MMFGDQHTTKTEESAKAPGIAADLHGAALKVEEAVNEEIPRSVSPSEHLSGTGQAVAADIGRIAKDTRQIVEEKVEPAAVEAEKKIRELEKGQGSTEAAAGQGVIKDEIQALLDIFKAGYEDFGHVARLLVYSTSFRQLLVDVVGIMQDALRDCRYVRQAQESEADTSTELRELQYKLTGTQTASGAVLSLSGEAMADLEVRFVEWLRRVRDTPEFAEAFAFLNDRFGQMQDLPILAITFKEEDTLNAEERKICEAARQSESVRMGISVKVFVEHWIGASLDPLVNGLNGLRKSVGKDEHAREKLDSFSKWLKSCLVEADDAAQLDRFKKEFSTQLSSMRLVVVDRYRGEVDHLMQETATIVERARRDELSVKLTSDLQDLFGHLFRDEAGSLTIKPELWGDVKIILPVFFQRLRFIRIPELVVRDESMDFRASGIVISVGALSPKRIQAHFHADLGSEDPGIASEHDLQSVIVLEAGKIYAEARNVYFEFDRKSFPPLSDSGIADLNIHGEDGMRLRLIFGTAGSAPASSGLRLLRAKCDIDGLDLRLHDTRHSWMYAALGPFIRRQLKARIEGEIENYFMSGEWVETMSKPEILAEALQAAARPSTI